jgi:hypothetical protein
MKQLTISLIVLLFCNILAAQNDPDELPKGPIVVPKIVLDSFQLSYSGIVNAKWEYGDGFYEVVFTKNGLEMVVDYDIYGKCEQTETEIKLSELPNAVTSYLNKKYKDFIITGASKTVTKSNILTFVVQVGKKGKILDITFNSEGKFLKEEEAD